MLLRVLLPFALVGFAVSIPSVQNGDTLDSECDTYISDEEMLTVEKMFKDRKSSLDRSSVSATATIDVYFNVIYEDQSFNGGNIPDAMIKKQIEVVNQGYKDSGLTFTLAGINRVQNSTWFRKVDSRTEQPRREMKTQLRKGGINTLNVYTLGFKDIGRGLLGQATFPWSYSTDPINDGVILRYSVLPGGNTDLKKDGKTLVHEIGHWVGLYHTFAGGCEGSGDQIDDTPALSGPTYACPYRPDTCKGQPGLDPIHNFMDYSSDYCRTQFTAGQIVRLKTQMAIRNITL